MAILPLFSAEAVATRQQTMNANTPTQNVFKFRGKPTNLGRFGQVETSDILTLTDREAECIVKDKRFEPVKDAKLSKAEQARLTVQNVSEMNREQLVAFCQ